MRIPEVRERFRQIAKQLSTAGSIAGDALKAIASEIDTLAGELHRRKPVQRARAKRVPMTAERADKIRAYHDANPDASWDDIGAVFNVDGGRVSEVIAGKRK